MYKTLNKKFVKLRNTLNDKNYLFTTIAYFIAPTIAKEKPSSLINFTKSYRNSYALWEKYKSELFELPNIHFYEIYRKKDSILVLFYNPQNLSKILSQKDHLNFLKSFGYNEEMNLNQFLDILKERFTKEFPHELGIFLGYPLMDVTSFIKNKGKNYLLCKYWKVYHNPQRAKDIFYNFDRAKIKTLILMENGVEPLNIIRANNLVLNDIV
ncbi:DUF3793 family protein [Desulfolucanica intricata]|uniref:DUF3793 family protein n=1 Tax=Desulfolucanica intricata TaxID=1285191 RepID=UPI000832BFAC|nr:DUF3793 family protein [Desulfolucanica intricata]